MLFVIFLILMILYYNKSLILYIKNYFSYLNKIKQVSIEIWVQDINFKNKEEDCLSI